MPFTQACLPFFPGPRRHRIRAIPQQGCGQNRRLIPWGPNAPVIVVDAQAATQVQELEVFKALAADLLDVLNHLGGCIPEQAHLHPS